MFLIERFVAFKYTYEKKDGGPDSDRCLAALARPTLA